MASKVGHAYSMRWTLTQGKASAGVHGRAGSGPANAGTAGSADKAHARRSHSRACAASKDHNCFNVMSSSAGWLTVAVPAAARLSSRAGSSPEGRGSCSDLAPSIRTWHRRQSCGNSRAGAQPTAPSRMPGCRDRSPQRQHSRARPNTLSAAPPAWGSSGCGGLCWLGTGMRNATARGMLQNHCSTRSAQTLEMLQGASASQMALRATRSQGGHRSSGCPSAKGRQLSLCVARPTSCWPEGESSNAWQTKRNNAVDGWEAAIKSW
mmetsp:Transcript_51503/g.159458  ORF Transcript_51503/g.159458 Transcript_51503/m.159458 type:complete len:265 (+) Transcript_51503:536-1330(+)